MQKEENIKNALCNLMEDSKKAVADENYHYAMICLEKAGTLAWVLKESIESKN